MRQASRKEIWRGAWRIQIASIGNRHGGGRAQIRSKKYEKEKEDQGLPMKPGRTTGIASAVIMKLRGEGGGLQEGNRKKRRVQEKDSSAFMSGKRYENCHQLSYIKEQGGASSVIAPAKKKKKEGRTELTHTI